METRAEEENKSLLTKIGLAAGKVINTFIKQLEMLSMSCYIR